MEIKGTHYFDVGIAKQYGVDEAIFIHTLQFWIIHNEANEKHFYDGRYWTYNTIEAFEKILPYFSKAAIKRIIKKLVDAGILYKSNYNKIAYDRTTWYALDESVLCIYRKQPLHCSKSANGMSETSPAIPVNNTFSNTINNNKENIIKENEKKTISESDENHDQEKTLTELNNKSDCIAKKKEKSSGEKRKKSFKAWTDDDFRNEIRSYKDKYTSEMLQGFYYYWSDEDINGRMKFQLQKTFSLSKRLALWNSNSRKWDKPKSNTTENLTSIAVNGAKMLLNELNRGD